jgi:hypothetical protein
MTRKSSIMNSDVNPKNGNVFKVNGHRLKPYLENFVAEVETLDLEDPIPL